MARSEKRQRRTRLDRFLVDRGLVESREKAQALILAGAVEVDGLSGVTAGMPVGEDARVRLREDAAGALLKYVGRGGLKLEAAIAGFGLKVEGKIAVDIGASTGGFTDCLLRHGAVRVHAIDVGYGQLAWSLRRDPRVDVIERANIRSLPPERIPEPVDLATIDVSFISLDKVLPKAVGLLRPDGTIVALVKPQFEVGKGEVERGGVIRDPIKRRKAVERIRRFAEGIGLRCDGVMASPVHGRDGNVEYFLLLKKSADKEGA